MPGPSWRYGCSALPESCDSGLRDVLPWVLADATFICEPAVPASIQSIQGKPGAATRTACLFAGLSTVLCALTRCVLDGIRCNLAFLEPVLAW